MIRQINAKEYAPNSPFRPIIRVIPPIDALPTTSTSPPFEFRYTNRIIYADGIVPVQSPGCGCDGDCDAPENKGSCACLKRQIEASRKRLGDVRSGNLDFAWRADGRLDDGVAEHSDLIMCVSHFSLLSFY
jgi:hypothetical protein